MAANWEPVLKHHVDRFAAFAGHAQKTSAPAPTQLKETRNALNEAAAEVHSQADRLLVPRALAECLNATGFCMTAIGVEDPRDLLFLGSEGVELGLADQLIQYFAEKKCITARIARAFAKSGLVYSRANMTVEAPDYDTEVLNGMNWSTHRLGWTTICTPAGSHVVEYTLFHPDGATETGLDTLSVRARVARSLLPQITQATSLWSEPALLRRFQQNVDHPVALLSAKKSAGANQSFLGAFNHTALRRLGEISPLRPLHASLSRIVERARDDGTVPFSNELRVERDGSEIWILGDYSRSFYNLLQAIRLHAPPAVSPKLEEECVSIHWSTMKKASTTLGEVFDDGQAAMILYKGEELLEVIPIHPKNTEAIRRHTSISITSTALFTTPGPDIATAIQDIRTEPRLLILNGNVIGLIRKSSKSKLKT